MKLPLFAALGVALGTASPWNRQPRSLGAINADCAIPFGAPYVVAFSLPSTVAAALFVWSGLNFSGIYALCVAPVWLAVIVAYDQLYESLVSRGRGPLARSRALGFVCVLSIPGGVLVGIVLRRKTLAKSCRRLIRKSS